MDFSSTAPLPFSDVRIIIPDECVCQPDGENLFFFHKNSSFTDIFFAFLQLGFRGVGPAARDDGDAACYPVDGKAAYRIVLFMAHGRGFSRCAQHQNAVSSLAICQSRISPSRSKFTVPSS